MNTTNDQQLIANSVITGENTERKNDLLVPPSSKNSSAAK